MKRRLKYPLIVEGKYDKATLSSLVEGDIFLTGGFRIYKDKEMSLNKLKLAKRDTKGTKVRV